MLIEPFGVEIWMNEWETRCDWNLAENLCREHNHSRTAGADRRRGWRAVRPAV